MLVLSTDTPKILIYISAAATLAPVTGLSGTSGLRFIKPDGTLATPTNGLTELDATNAKGWYSVLVAGGDAISVGEWALSYQTPTTAANIGLVRFMVNGPVDARLLLGTMFATPATAGVLDVNVKNINNVVAATPGASGGVLISGSNTGTTTLGAFTVTGATTLTGNVLLSGTLTVTGAVAFSSTFGVSGTVTYNAFTVTNALTVSGTTTFTGAVAMSSTCTITGAFVWTGGLTYAIDGVQHSVIQKMLLSFFAGKATPTSQNDGTTKYDFYAQDGTTKVMSPIASDATNARTATVTPS